jgi:four helix bundle protein
MMRTLAVYRQTATFPREELCGLTSQIRRCAVSVATNIAEGYGKRGNAEFQRFLSISTGSVSELENHLLLSRDLRFLRDADYKRLQEEVVEVKRMLAGLIRKVEQERLEG